MKKQVLVDDEGRIVFRHVRGNMWTCENYNFNCFVNYDLRTDLMAALNREGIYPVGRYHWE